MNKNYGTNIFLMSQDSEVYSIFAWSQRESLVIPNLSWLLILEILVHEHSLEKVYQIFHKIKNQEILPSVMTEIEAYQKQILNPKDAIIFLGDNHITLLGKGFRSFIEKENQFELADLSKATYQVLLGLFSQQKLVNDLDSIHSQDQFNQVVEKIQEIGLISPAKGTIDWGDLSRKYPICQAFGLTRGTPVDRYYLNQFIREIRPQIKGDILEIGGTPKDKDFYQIESDQSYKIVNIEPGPGVDIVGDVHDPSIIEPESIDSLIIFNVLEHCYAPWLAVENIYRWLKIGGKCFAMVPSAIRVHATPVDYWRPLPDGFKWIFRSFRDCQLYVYGNPMTVIASYHGIAVEELTREQLDAFHPDYPVATCIVASK
jgi:SAM-dependent methyltransferase